MIFENENPDAEAGDKESVGALSMQYTQCSICPCTDVSSTANRCHFDKKQADSNARRVLARQKAFTPAKAPECSPLPSQKRLQDLFKHCDITGFLTGRVSRGGRLVGEVCGTDCHGYVQVSVDGKIYRAHRIIFKMAYGRDPVGYLDHIDGDRSNNRLENLREVTPWENNMNRAAPSTSNTRHLGVYWDMRQNKFLASIGIGGKAVHLGRFSKICCAIAARKHAFDLLVGAPSNDNGRADK